VLLLKFIKYTLLLETVFASSGELKFVLIVVVPKLEVYNPQLLTEKDGAPVALLPLGNRFLGHFTSPIRRYPDVLTHRLLMRVLENDYPREEERPLYDRLCVQASNREKEAADAERGSVKYKQVEYMSYRLGQQFDGVISGVSEWGLFVSEKKSKCEGMIRLRDLGDDFYVYDQKNSRVFGERTGIEWKIGTPVKIKVKAANLDLRVIDYELVA
jgi:ribonuclease R